jgi:hypothetical protein
MAVNILNDAYNNLVTKLEAITGLRVASDPRNLNPPTAFVQAPTATLNTNGVYGVQFGVQIIGLGVGDRKGLETMLELVDKIRVARIGLTSANPTVQTVGGQEYIAYDLAIQVKIGP